MNSYKLLSISLLMSLAIHSAFLFGLRYQWIKSATPLQLAEVFYEQKAQRLEIAPSPKASLPPLEKSQLPRMNLPKSEKLTYKKGNPIEFYLKNEVFETEKNISFVEKPNPKKVINLPNVPGEIARSSEYKSYYQIIREKIRRLAYRNYKKLYEGEVFLTFAIDPNGGLLASEVKKDKSTPNSYLCDIATQSVQEASPYPAFPDKLKNNKRLTFNVIISFEIK